MDMTHRFWKLFRNTVMVIGVLFLSVFVLSPGTVQAAQTVPTLVNFQGRLADSTGAPLADGSYNIRFRAYYNAPTGGSPTWTETHDGANRVAVKNGIFSTQLGSITPLDSSGFTGYTVYIEIELPTPVTATCDGVGCSPSWSEGAMTPRQPIASSAYAMNADLVDGIDGASLAQLSANQTFSGDNTFTGTFLQQNTSSTAFRVQNAGGANALLIDTSSLAVKIGGGNVTPDASPALLVFDYKNTAGDPTGTEGAIYYNTVTGKMRCYEDGMWRDCIGQARTRLEERDDFIGPFTYGNGAQFNPAFVSGLSAGSAARIAAEASHPGIIRATTNSGTTAVFAIAMNYDPALNVMQFGSGTWTFTITLRVPVASTSAQRFTLVNGFMDNPATLSIVSGCYFRYVDNLNAGAWQGVCRNSNSETSCDPKNSSNASASALPANGSAIWYDLRVRVNPAANLATFTMTSPSGTYTCTVSSNIPTTNKVTAGFNIIKSAGFTARTVDYDSVEVIGEGLSR